MLGANKGGTLGRIAKTTYLRSRNNTSALFIVPAHFHYKHSVHVPSTCQERGPACVAEQSLRTHMYHSIRTLEMPRAEHARSRRNGARAKHGTMQRKRVGALQSALRKFICMRCCTEHYRSDLFRPSNIWRCAKTPYRTGDSRTDISWDVSRPYSKREILFSFSEGFLIKGFWHSAI